MDGVLWADKERGRVMETTKCNHGRIEHHSSLILKKQNVGQVHARLAINGGSCW